MGTKIRTVQWVGLDDPRRLDAATIHFGNDFLNAVGTSRASGYAATWELRTDPGWVTRYLGITVRGFGWSRQLELMRALNGEWSITTECSGETDLPAPGLPNLESLAGAIDCDLGLCPVTNTMPIRRLGLLDGPVEETQLTMAWVAVPSLEVVPSGQIYSSAPALRGPNGGPNMVSYQSLTRDFRSTLSVDEDGVVIEYPSLARRI
jgi:uncharacterized protein